MDVELRVDLVQENVDALARFDALFGSHRFHVIACPGVDPGQSTDLKTLRRLMQAVLAASASRGMEVPRVPAPEMPPEVQVALSELLAVIQERAAEAGLGGGALLVDAIEHIIEVLTEGRQEAPCG